MKKSSLTLKLINAPYMIWAVLFILAPLIMVIYYAFTDRSGAFTLDNIKALSSYGAIFGRSAWYAVLATVICLILAYPLAYIMAKSRANTQRTIMMLIMLPMWMNFLIRTYSWITILKYRPYKFAFKGCGAAHGAAYQHSGRGNPRNGI